MRADFSLDYDVLTVEQPQKLYLMARLESGPVPHDLKRRPLNLSLVIDRSGSMAGEKIDFTRQAAQFLVQNLSLRDRLSIVLYNDKIETLLAPELVQRKDHINQLIQNIKVSGTTNLSGGWLEGCKHVTNHLAHDVLNRVILMTDGLANRGVTEPDKLIPLARQKRGESISTTTMGLGTDFNEDLLMAMADAGGGAFYFIENPEAAPVIFKEELQGLLNLVGQNLVISVDPSEHVTMVNQLNAYPMHSDGRRVNFQLGDVFGDEIKTLILELSIPALKDMGAQQIAVLRFEYDQLLESSVEHHVWEMPVVINIQPGSAEPKKLADPNVAQAVLLLKAAQARGDAVRSADRGEYEAAARMLEEMARVIAESNLNDERLKEEYEALLRQAEEMKRGVENYDKYHRKTMVTQALYSMTGRHDETVVLRQRERQRQTPAQPQPEDAAIPRKPGVPPTHFTWNEQTFALNRDLMRIGRATHNEIVLDAQGVSRFHCQIRREANKLILEDLGSTNGTSMDGIFLDMPHELSVGDVIYLCDEKLIFHDGHLPSMPKRPHTAE